MGKSEALETKWNASLAPNRIPEKVIRGEEKLRCVALGSARNRPRDTQSWRLRDVGSGAAASFQFNSPFACDNACVIHNALQACTYKAVDKGPDDMPSPG